MNKMKYILPVLFLLVSFNTFGQVVKFEKVYGGSGYDYGNSVIQVFDKGYVVAGNTTSYGSGNNDVYLIKTDSNGYTQWQRTFGGINVDQSFSVKQTRDSGLVVAGYTNSFGHGGYDMYVIRTDRNGDTLWTKTYGGSNWDFAYSIDTTNDGGFIVAGGTYSYGKGDEDMYLVKLNAIGDTLWTKTYGGLHQEEIASVHQTADSGYIFTGETKSFEDSIAGDIYIVKTNTLGDTTWTKSYGSSGEDKGSCIIQKRDGGYAIAATLFNTALHKNQSYIMSTNQNGDTLWTQQSGVPNNALANSVVQANDNGLVWAGQLNLGGQNDIYFKKFDAGGNYGFATTFGVFNGEENAYGLEQTADRGYIIVGNTNGTGYGLNDVLLIKTDSLGYSTGTIVIGISEFIAPIEGVSINPNPFSENATVEMKLPTNFTKVSFKIFDSFGQEMNQYSILSSLNGQKMTFDLNGRTLASGLYYLQINSNENIICRKFIVQH